MNKIKNIIFDIGQVLKGWHPERLYELFDKETADGIYDAFWGHGYWFDHDLGVEDEGKLLEKMLLSHPECEKEILYIYEHLEIISEKFTYAIPWVKELKESGYQVYYLSNYSRHLRESVPQTIDFLPLMDGGVFSCDVHILKPDKRIYQILCDKYELLPGECFFIDDREENVEAARAFGMQGYVFGKYEADYEKITSILKDNI